MRLMVFYDLPVVTKENRRTYARFHKFLLRDGYDMIQYSVYARICNGQDGVNKHAARLAAHLPGEGCVRTMQVTEKQFVRMEVLIGPKTVKEDLKMADQLSFF